MAESERRRIAGTTPALRATPPQEGNYRPPVLQRFRHQLIRPRYQNRQARYEIGDRMAKIANQLLSKTLYVNPSAENDDNP